MLRVGSHVAYAWLDAQAFWASSVCVTTTLFILAWNGKKSKRIFMTSQKSALLKLAKLNACLFGITFVLLKLFLRKNGDGKKTKVLISCGTASVVSWV